METAVALLLDILTNTLPCNKLTSAVFRGNYNTGSPSILPAGPGRTSIYISIILYIYIYICIYSKIMRDYEKTIVPKRLCNCSPANRNNCPLNGQCLLQSLVYRADVTTDRPDEHRFYFGLVSNSFKARYGNHLKSFRHEKYKNETTLSSYFWHLKEKGRSPNIKWSVAKRAPPYNPASKKCRLCLTEKTLILEHASDPNMLNTRTEMFSKCRYRWKHVLAALR